MHDQDFYGDKFKWFVGSVREISPDRTKVRVRVFGVHRMDDTVDVSDGDLPYAVVLMPTTAGEGSNTNMTHGLQVGDMVVGFYADGDDCMQPIVVGVVPGGINSERTAPSPGGGGGDGGDGGGGGSSGGFDSDSSIPGGEIPSLGEASGECSAFTKMTVWEKAHIEKAYNYIRYMLEEKMPDNEGNVHYQTIGIMAHLSAESDWKLDIVNGIGAIGLDQWLGGRKTRLMAKPNWQNSLTVQLDFIFEEFRTSERLAWANFRKAQSLFDAVYTYSFFVRFEGVYASKRRSSRPGGYYVDIEDAKRRGGWNKRVCKAAIYDRIFADRYTRPENSPTPTFGGQK